MVVHFLHRKSTALKMGLLNIMPRMERNLLVAASQAQHMKTRIIHKLHKHSATVERKRDCAKKKRH